MDFSDSYYSVSITKNGVVTNKVFNDTSIGIIPRREDAVNYFFECKKAIELEKNIDSYQIDFTFIQHKTYHDFDYGNRIEFYGIQELNLFSVKDNQVLINYLFWSVEAEEANNYRSRGLLNNEVCITDDYIGKEYWVYDDNICTRLGIDFKYR